MGEIAEMMINGEMCQECGQFLAEEHGYPISCVECDGEAELDPAYDE